MLLVEDDDSQRTLMEFVLRSAGFTVSALADGRGVLERLAADGIDLVLLDLMLPGVDGFDLGRRIREHSKVPLVIVTARDDTADLVAGLELGADDYVRKPFEAPELLARVRAVLRRATPAEGEVLRVGAVRVDTRAYAASKGGQPLDLSATEFRLLSELARAPGHARTREGLLRRVWGYDYLGGSRAVDMAVKRLREKIEDDPRQPRIITTVRGVGYRMEAG